MIFICKMLHCDLSTPSIHIGFHNAIYKIFNIKHCILIWPSMSQWRLALCVPVSNNSMEDFGQTHSFLCAKHMAQFSAQRCCRGCFDASRDLIASLVSDAATQSRYRSQPVVSLIRQSSPYICETVQTHIEALSTCMWSCNFEINELCSLSDFYIAKTHIVSSTLHTCNACTHNSNENNKKDNYGGILLFFD